MSEPRDLGLESLDDRDGQRSAHLGKVAHVAYLTGSRSTRTSYAAYEALIDAVFTAPGAAEWLSGLRRSIAALFAEKDSALHFPPATDAIRTVGPRQWRP